MLFETVDIDRIDTARDLAALTDARLEAGQRQLAHAMRVLIASDEPEIAAALDDAQDEPLLEPLVFSYFASREPCIGLGQLLYGNLSDPARPDAVEVAADERGLFYLPGIGYLDTAEPRARALLIRAPGGRFLLERDGEPLPFRFQAMERIGSTHIELLSHVSPLLSERFVDTAGRRATAEADPQRARRGREVERALQWLEACAPEYGHWLRWVTRQLCVFRAESVNSFASINAHGTAFFNTGPLDPDSHDDTVFFYDELVHQCGHIIFNALTVARTDFFAIDPETPLAKLSPEEADGRTVYDALHGLYTEHMMSACMLALEQRGLVTDPRQAHELRGRLSFIVHKYCVDLANLAHAHVFTPLGRSLYDYFRVSCLNLLRARPDLMALRLDGQPYNFDYRRFAAHNPRPM